MDKVAFCSRNEAQVPASFVVTTNQSSFVSKRPRTCPHQLGETECYRPSQNRSRRPLLCITTVASPSDVEKTSPTRTIFGSGTFSALGLGAPLIQALQQMEIMRPTGIQTRGIPAIMGGTDVILGAATGCGKTLAFLLPVVEMLKAEETLGDLGTVYAGKPRALIVLPTRELAEQVLAVTKRLSHYAKFRTAGLIGGAGSLRKQKDRLTSGAVDVVVATTGRLLQMMDTKSIDLRMLKYLVIDEVDTMFDAGFGPELQKILRYSRGRDGNNKPQYISVGATHPKAAIAVYEEEFPTANRIEVDLHRVPPGLQQRFILTNQREKISQLVGLLGEAKKDGALRGGRIVIFCNTIDSCRFVDHFLSESGYVTSSVHGSIPPDRRDAEYKSFKEGKTQVLVCTDIAARGLDNLAIDHVILFDFPASPVDYIHRAGRTARAGAEGRVTSLILKKDAVLAKAIEYAGKGKADTLETVRAAREEQVRRKRAERVARSEREMDERDAKPGNGGSHYTPASNVAAAGIKLRKRTGSARFNPKGETYAKKARKYEARYGGRHTTLKKRTRRR
eukprot:Plantae.Rhodophyta-Hildenbrandia_rubra.ctg10583.p1 GENE.Plantae.Rhodophyta-Hildenbrandia_rubra.ctg10583~~Plantae.Rhodophyta-Hildenbrandia_rubra.ctg10583.p1  ORF type:complete len:562 (-),score=92.71 Plantae.Rhodophyta-Hildenbrandia_rubra.ctg10583:242-1927(-)